MTSRSFIVIAKATEDMTVATIHDEYDLPPALRDVSSPVAALRPATEKIGPGAGTCL